MNKRLWLTATSSALALLLGGCATAPAPRNLAETIAAAPQLSTLNKLITQAGLTSTLQAAGPLTLFAPTNEAFNAVPATTLEALAGDKARLSLLLSYHLVSATLLAADVKNGNVKTVQGANIALSKSGNFVTVEDAVVTTTDMTATNGVLHVIDRVLTPPAK